ncbi:hypothetical protein C5Y93_03525, partial [Blastopirellula marina]
PAGVGPNVPPRPPLGASQTDPQRPQTAASAKDLERVMQKAVALRASFRVLGGRRRGFVSCLAGSIYSINMFRRASADMRWEGFALFDTYRCGRRALILRGMRQV